jgi:predicted Zn-dependent peptidase
MNQPDRYTPPVARKLEPVTLREPEKYTLPNGIPVFQYNSGSQELVRIEMIFKAGSWYQEEPFTAMAANLMLQEGTAKRSAAAIAEALEYRGAYFETTAEKDNAYITLYTLNKHLEFTLPVLEEIIKEAAFSANEFGIMAGKQRQSLVVNQEKVNYLARTRFNALVFGREHPYGAYVNPEDIDELRLHDALQFYRDFYHSGNCSIMIAGKVPPELEGMLLRHFGGSDWNGRHPQRRVWKKNPENSSLQFISKPGALQSAIRIGRELFNRSHPDFTGMRVLNTVLGGYFGSRLMRNLREDKGFTYGVGSAAIPLHETGLFFITCEVGADATRQALDEIHNELAALRSSAVKKHELDLVKNYMSGTFLRSIDGPFAMADVYRSVMEDGLDTEYISRSLDTVMHITPAQLSELARRYLNPDDMHILVAGPEKP